MTARRLLFPALLGALIAVALGVYGKVHDPAGTGVLIAGFSSAGTAKSWMATAAVFLALVQVTSAVVMFRSGAPKWAAPLHRWSGRGAFFLAIPVAVHCLYSLGFQSTDTRVLLHSLLGCLFFGAFTVKMLGLRIDSLPVWVLPLLGGLVFTLLIAVWLLSAVWFFNMNGLGT
jgi:hypothetical protein